MTTINEIADDPNWLPHDIDQQRGHVRFLKIDRQKTEDHGFLANLGDTGLKTSIPINDVLSIKPPMAPIHFIFHSGFCRSTLLLRAMQSRDLSVCLNEPEILNSLARLGRPDQNLVDSIVQLLARRQRNGETVIVKPSNFVNRLIPQLLHSNPQARGVIVTNRLHEFLEAVVRKGLQGRQWARQVYLAVSTYAGKVDQYDKLVPGLTDLQVASLGWLLTQNWFAKQVSGPHALSLATLHSHEFNVRRMETIEKTTEHFDLNFHAERIESIVNGPVFKTDAKLGGDYASKAALDEARTQSVVVEEEIAAMSKWIGKIAQVSRLTVPIPQSLY